MNKLTGEEKFTEFWPGDEYADLWPGHWKAGMWMWLLHRITGFFVIGYGIFHLGETALASLPGNGPEVFNKFYRVVGLHPLVQVLDTILMAALLYHGFNGLRLTLIDFLGVGTRRRRQLFWVLMGAGVIVWLVVVKETIPYIIRS